MPTRRLVFWLAGTIAIAGAAQCSRPSDPVLDCTASDIRHILRIRASDHQVDDLSATPAKHGEAELSDAGYVLRFLEHRDGYELIFRINSARDSGTRELFDDEQQAIRGHGGFDEISCKPYGGNP